ncbi:hypothetical protein LINPERHAP1_LOCUS492, partial [Linum perenne]
RTSSRRNLPTNNEIWTNWNHCNDMEPMIGYLDKLSSYYKYELSKPWHRQWKASRHLAIREGI